MRVRVLLPCVLVLVLMAAGCSIIEIRNALNTRPIPLEAFDQPLTGEYLWYDVSVADRFRFSHKWLMRPCEYRVLEPAPYTRSWTTGIFSARPIIEKDGKTWQRASDGSLFDFDPWVRSVRIRSRDPRDNGEIIELGLEPVCFDYWWRSSQYLRVLLFRMTLDEFEAYFADRYPPGPWVRQTRNDLEWRVRQVRPEQIRPAPLNGLGGPYRVWMTQIADTGYAIAFEMGASTESLAHPRAMEALAFVFDEIVGSFRIEPLEPVTASSRQRQPGDNK